MNFHILTYEAILSKKKFIQVFPAGVFIWEISVSVTEISVLVLKRDVNSVPVAGT